MCWAMAPQKSTVRQYQDVLVVDSRRFSILTSVVFLLLFSSHADAITQQDCWSFVWPGPFNWQALNVTATCKQINIAGSEAEMITGGGGGDGGDSGKLFLRFGASALQHVIGTTISVPGQGDYLINPDPRLIERALDDEDSMEIPLDVPCYEPIVFTYNNTRPDVVVMMDMLNIGELPAKTRCSRVGDQWCIKWSHFQGSNPIQVSRFCGSARQANPAGNKITAGCYTQEFDRYTREVCFCDNENMCNGGHGLFSSHSATFSFLLAFVVTFLSRNIF